MQNEPPCCGDVMVTWHHVHTNALGLAASRVNSQGRRIRVSCALCAVCALWDASLCGRVSDGYDGRGIAHMPGRCDPARPPSPCASEVARPMFMFMSCDSHADCRTVSMARLLP